MENYSEQSTTSKKNKSGKKKRFSKKVISYYFDNALSKSSNFVLYVVLISFLLGLLMFFLKDFLSLNSEDGFLDNWWVNVSEILELGQGDSWPDRLIEFIFWFMSIAITGTVIGFLSSKINAFFNKISRGKSFIIGGDHILIIGWSNNLFAILKELDIANESERGQKVVIFADIPNTKMQDDLSLITSKLKSLKILTRSGDPSNPSEIEIPNPNEAKSILILNNEEKKDPYVVTTTLSVCSVLTNKNIPIISSIKERYYYDSLKNIVDFNIIPVMPENIISNVAAQSLRQRGLGLVVLDFLDFDGDEIYFKHVPELAGSTFLEAILSFEDSSVIGIFSNNCDVNLAVANDYKISENDELIFIAADDSAIHYSKNAAEFGQSSADFNLSDSSNAKRILFLGWSSLGVKILDSISGFLDDKSSVDIVFIDDYCSSSIVNAQYAFEINFLPVTPDFDLEGKLKDKNYDDVMIIGYSDKLSINEADSFTLLKSLELDSIMRKNKFDCRVLTHILNSSKSKLTEITHSKEIIISDNLSALLMAQLSENYHLYRVFEKLFSSEDSSINIFPIDFYVELDKEITYKQVVLSAAVKNHNAVGLLFKSIDSADDHEGLEVNPKKSMTFTPSKGDSLIVIS